MELSGNVAVHLTLIGKRVVYFLLVLIELFSLYVTAEVLRANIDRRFCSNGVRYKRSSSTNHSACRKTRMDDLSCRVKCGHEFRSF